MNELHGAVVIGGQVNQFRVALRIYGVGMDPDELSRLLGVSPTWSHRTGDPISPRVPNRRTQSAWIFELSAVPEETPELAIERLLSALPAERSIWEHLALSYRMDLGCNVELGGDNRGFVLSPEVLQNVASRKLVLSFDIWGAAWSIGAASVEV